MFTDVVEQLVSLHLQKGDTMSALITGEWCAFSASLQPLCISPTRGAFSEHSTISYPCMRMAWLGTSGRAPLLPAGAVLCNTVWSRLFVKSATSEFPDCNLRRYMRNNHFPRFGRPYEFNAHLYKSVGRAEESRDSVSIRQMFIRFESHQKIALCLQQRAGRCLWYLNAFDGDRFCKHTVDQSSAPYEVTPVRDPCSNVVCVLCPVTTWRLRHRLGWRCGCPGGRSRRASRWRRAWRRCRGLPRRCATGWTTARRRAARCRRASASAPRLTARRA